MNIRSVAYLGIGARDPGSWLTYGVDVLGMMPARAVPGEGWGIPGGPPPPSARSGIAPDGSVYLKMDERQWRIAVHPDREDSGLRYLGLEVESAAELAAAVRTLRKEGCEVEDGSDEDAFARAVTGMARVRDPAGIALELFYGPTMDYQFASAVPGLRFVAGHLGVGHCNMFVRNQPACFDFYTRLLGFRLTDFITLGPGVRLQFLRCNRRHHSIAMVDVGGISGLQHLMIEVPGVDAVGIIHDRARRAGVQITSTLGRHRNDGVLSFYMRSPADFDVEIGCEGLLVDETWTTNEFCEGDVWGHEGIVEAIQHTGAIMRSKSTSSGRV